MSRVRTYEEHALGLTWVVDEPMARASHALLDEGRVWIVDPVDVEDAVDRAAALGEPVAVLQLLDRHNRDCAAVAERLGVPHVRLPRELPDAPMQPIRVLDRRFWREVALWWPAREALVVAEAVGTNRMFTGGFTPLGVHLFLRLTPPKVLARYRPEHLLVGHGGGIQGDAAATALEQALARSRSDLPKVVAKLPSALRS